MKPSGTQEDILQEYLEDEKGKPVIDHVFPFSKIAKAFNYSRSGTTKGKIILTIRKP